MNGARFGTQLRGLGQGCPLSPGLFAATVAKALGIAQACMRVIDREAIAPAYLDGSYLVGAGEAVKTGLRAFMGALDPLGLQLNQAKTKLFSALAPEDLPGDLRQWQVK
jgi:hypothetical protein